MKKQMIRVWTALLLILSCSVSASALPKTLIPGGCTIGMKLYTQGLIVTEVEHGSAARVAGIRKGDVIVQVDGETVHTAASLRRSLEEEQVILTVLRDGKEAEFCVRPERTEQGSRIGAHVRDSLAGIGTVTYYDPNTGDFGALGHGVSDLDTSLLLPVEAGVVVESAVAEVRKGKSGEPGELKGVFDVEDIQGSIEANTDHGVFGTLTTPVPGTPLPVASAEAVRPGHAEILANVSGEEIRAYSVEILEVYPRERASGRDLLLRVTDPDLLRQTGGIVQGMSGSPVIQNGRIVGAVTHVLVNDPTRGYGIFIENMLEAAK